MVEVMKIMATSLKDPMHVLLQSMPLSLQQATTHSRLYQRLPDTHRRVSCGVIVPFSWVLVHKFLLCPPRVNFPVLCKFWQLYGGVNGDLLQEDLCWTLQAPVPVSDHYRPLPPQETLKDSSVSVSVGPLGPGTNKGCLSPLSISGGNGI